MLNGGADQEAIDTIKQWPQQAFLHSHRLIPCDHHKVRYLMNASVMKFVVGEWSYPMLTANCEDVLLLIYLVIKRGERCME